MSKIFLGNKNLLEYLATFFDVNNLLTLSSSNKSLKGMLSPLENSTVNKIFYRNVNKRFFEMEEDFEFDKSYKAKKNNLLDIYWKNTINWQLYLIQLNKHFNNYPEEKIIKKVKNILRIHLYLHDLRKENYHLEFSNSSIYQIFSYDKKNREECTYNFYNKYINEEYIKKQDKECEIKVLRTGLFFESELKNFFKAYNEINSCYDYKDILEAINNYDFEKLDNFYEKVNKSNVNNIIYFILWINRTLKYYCMYILNSVNIFEDDLIGRIYLEEYIDKYNNFVNSILLINSNFENINIIINYLTTFIFKKNYSQKFSLEQLAMKIFKKTVYDKISEKIQKKTFSLFNKFLINNLENINEEEGKNDNKREDKMDIEIETATTTNDTSIQDISLDESFSEYTKENTDKEILENLLKCILDFSMDKKNINAINHSCIKLDDSYQNYENNFIKTAKEIIEEELRKYMQISEIFEILKKLLENDGNSRKSLNKNNNCFGLINKTKKNFLNSTFQLLYKEILQELNRDLNSRLKPHMKGRTICISNIEKINNKNYSCDLSYFSQKKKMNIEGKVQDELNKLKTFLYENNLKGFDSVETNKLVNEYIENNGIQLVLLTKKIIYFFYKECEYYDEKDQKVYDILTSKGNNDTENSSFERIIQM